MTYPVERREEILAQLLEWVSDGKPMREFARQPGMPGYVTLYSWLKTGGEELRLAFEAARECGAEALAEEALHIAYTPEIGERQEVEWDDSEGYVPKKTFREDMLGHRRLKVDTILKLLAKWFPQRYGDKVQVEGGVPLRIFVDTGVQPPAEAKLGWEVGGDE